MDIQGNIAANVRAARARRDLTLDEAARATGVSRSMLSQIEKGAVNPTISVVWKISEGLKVSFSSLVEAQGDNSTVIRAADVTPLEEGDGRYVNYPAFPFQDGRQFETYRIRIEPGGSLSADAHIPGTEEYLTVFAGAAEVATAAGTPNEEKFTLATGDSLHFRADAPHSYANPGDADCWLSMILYYS